ncbi:hypothetical protein CSKR_106028 [Clonorchis sinensis]|uniref:Uncharacterized protein n=1 Tax=Clonorchis sinensis TaxID=79923 RepID=A0A3R7JG32_CLOSI|nr:hypothetical protein CSKR_106028 [Clonorchis sinensis]
MDIENNGTETTVYRKRGDMAQWSERKSTEQKIRVSNPTPTSRLLLSRIGYPGSIPALVLPSDDVVNEHRRGIKAQRLLLYAPNNMDLR